MNLPPNVQVIDLFQPLMHSQKGQPPIAIRVGTTPSTDSMVGGPQMSQVRIEQYVLL
jgi:hypothetical protein